VEASTVTPSDLPLSWQLLESLSRLVDCDEIAFIGISSGAESYYFG